jgi:hypothetical protein
MSIRRVDQRPMALDAGSMNGIITAPVLKTPQKPSVTPNVLEVVFGSLLIQPWYPSFYPEQIVGRKVERLHVCQWCFKYSMDLMGFLRHLVCFNIISAYAREANIDVESLSTSYYSAARCQCVYKRQLLPIRDRWREAETLRAESLPLCEAIPRHQVGFLRRNDIFILLACRTRSHAEYTSHRHGCKWGGGTRAGGGLLQQREDELGQQQSGLHFGLSAVAETRFGPNTHGCKL